MACASQARISADPGLYPILAKAQSIFITCCASIFGSCLCASAARAARQALPTRASSVAYAHSDMVCVRMSGLVHKHAEFILHRGIQK